MATMPAASPSSPSMRLIALVMPEQPQHGDERDPLVAEDEHVDERDAEVEHRDAEVDEHRAHHDRAEHLRRRRDLADVVDEADQEHQRRGVAARPAARSCGRTAGRTRPTSAPRANAATNPMNIAMPPTSGVTTCARVRSSGSTTQPDARATPDHQRGDGERDDGRDGTDDEVFAGAGHQRHRQRHGHPGDQV